MEDIYSNLDNFNEVNALEELKTENKELKIKLEEYATAMEKLQKDFDTLSSEFKKLEHNYSSLLKTARLEIERKTQIITNINIEKDILVLSALQNGDKSVLNRIKNTAESVKHNKNKASKADKKKKEKKPKVVQENQNKKCDSSNERLHDHQTLSNDRFNSISRENRHNLINDNNAENNKASNTDSSTNVNSDIKENIQHGFIAKTVKPKRIHIKNKHNSIPVTNVECEKNSSDENVVLPKVNGSQQDYLTRRKEDRKSFFKNGNEIQSSRISETSSVDDKSAGYREFSRETFKGRSHKHYDDKCRSRDKYETSQRYKRHCSPDRFNRKLQRDYYDDYSQRPDFSRSRIRESPPVDRFHHHSYKEYQIHSETNYLNEQERYMHSQDRYAPKHKIPHEYDESYKKRQKTDYYSRQKEDVRWHENDFSENQVLTETFEQLQGQYTSCQSPDYIYSDIVSEPIKVIMNTAETQLEDPRLATSKYTLSSDKGLVTLSTTKGKHVDLHPVDKKKWGMNNMTVPNALVQLPLEEQLIKDLYDDINNPQQIELGEVCIDSQNVPNEHLLQNKPTEIRRLEKTNYKSSCTKKTYEIEKVQKAIHVNLSSYKIPKIKKCDQEIKSSASVKEKSLEIIEDLCTVVLPTKEDKNEKQKGPSSLTSLDKHDNTTNSDIGKDKKTCADFRNSVEGYENRRVLSTREIVEGDLELSDETCDNTELQKMINHNSNEENVNYHKYKICPTNLRSSTLSDIDNYQLKKSDKTNLPKCEPNHKEMKLNDQEEILPQTEQNVEHIELSKKIRNKKKIAIHKESEHIEVIDKKLKSKKDKKEKPKEIKTKFNDLFGDSNSLITPDDLGISASQIENPSQLTARYVPIFEDAQDATDLEQSTNIKPAIVPESKAVIEVNTNVGNNGKINVESNSKINEISKVVSETQNCTDKLLIVPEPVVSSVHEGFQLEQLNKESDIVTTIIISTGVQPDDNNAESSSCQMQSLVNAEELLSEDIEQDHNGATLKSREMLIKALATSTPHKHVVHQIAFDIDSKLPDSICNANNSLTSVENVSTCISNTNNTLEPPSEDLPDVRIFVKRRRKVVKTAK